ncbi:hypothetical protein [Halomicrobium katesii]|uniref:hypothetical protein n=1 Tax=Halomicrobium katesii TaxID=437163 RepID=UPI0005D240B8|nr:hypothetical protein [Halomicrobium katesii]
MTASTKRKIPRNGNRTALSRYDLVLAVIPTAFVVALLSNVLFGIPLRTVLPASSLVGVLALADTLYVNPPIDGS